MDIPADGSHCAMVNRYTSHTLNCAPRNQGPRSISRSINAKQSATFYGALARIAACAASSFALR